MDNPLPPYLIKQNVDAFLISIFSRDFYHTLTTHLIKQIDDAFLISIFFPGTSTTPYLPTCLLARSLSTSPTGLPQVCAKDFIVVVFSTSEIASTTINIHTLIMGRCHFHQRCKCSSSFWGPMGYDPSIHPTYPLLQSS